ncbi:MAG: outer membrane lipoprotein-sorting protein [bacterium]
MKWFRVFIVMILVAAIAVPVTAEESEQSRAEEIAWKAYEATYFRGKSVKSRAKLRIEDNQGRVRTRVLSILRKNVGEQRQKYYSYFHKPADLRQMVFMVWTRPGKDDDRWLYLPSIDLVQRITGSQKRNSFAGSNFTYEDMTGRYPGNDKFEHLGTKTMEGDTVYVLKGTPRNPEMVEFSYYKAYVNTETYLPEKSVFYTPQGKPHRTLTLEKVETIEGIVTPVVQKAVNHQTGSTTVATMSDIDYNIGVPERVFEQRYLRRPPTPYIRP